MSNEELVICLPYFNAETTSSVSIGGCRWIKEGDKEEKGDSASSSIEIPVVWYEKLCCLASLFDMSLNSFISDAIKRKIKGQLPLVNVNCRFATDEENTKKIPLSLPLSIHKKVKVYCANNCIKMKEFVLMAVFGWDIESCYIDD